MDYKVNNESATIGNNRQQSATIGNNRQQSATTNQRSLVTGYWFTQNVL